MKPQQKQNMKCTPPPENNQGANSCASSTPAQEQSKLDPVDILERLVSVEDRAKSNTHQIKEIKETQTVLLNMNKNIGIIAQQTKTTNEVVTKLKDDVDDLKEKENSRQAIERDKQKRREEFRQGFKGKLLYKIIEYTVVIVIAFVFLCISTYVRNFILQGVI